jgi:flagellar basal-body rod protein FlgB
MSMSFLDTPLSRAIKAGLDVGAVNHRLISDNIANADTPGYKGLRLNFDAYYDKAKRLFESEDTSTLMDPSHYIFRDDSTTMRLDGNNVDPEREMVELAQNSLNYATLIELLNRRGAYIRMIVTEGVG